MKLVFAPEVSRGKRVSGMTLMEVMVSVALGSIVLAMASSMWLFGSRSFAAMGNYADLDAKSRNALDLMSRDIREATRVTGFQNSGSTRWLQVTNAAQGTAITYTWNASPRTLVCQRTGEPDAGLFDRMRPLGFRSLSTGTQKGRELSVLPGNQHAPALMT